MLKSYLTFSLTWLEKFILNNLNKLTLKKTFKGFSVFLQSV